MSFLGGSDRGRDWRTIHLLPFTDHWDSSWSSWRRRWSCHSYDWHRWAPRICRQTSHYYCLVLFYYLELPKYWTILIDFGHWCLSSHLAGRSRFWAGVGQCCLPDQQTTSSACHYLYWPTWTSHCHWINLNFCLCLFCDPRWSSPSTFNSPAFSTSPTW